MTSVTFPPPNLEKLQLDLRGEGPERISDPLLRPLRRTQAPGFSFGTACTFPIICFWPLMHAKRVQSSLFSFFFPRVDSKDGVEVRVCLLAAFVRVFV